MTNEATAAAAHTTTDTARHLAAPTAAQKTPAEQRKHARKLARRRHRDAERRADERDARRAALEQLFFANSAFISDAVLADPRLTFQDADAISYAVAHYLDKYSNDDDLTDEAFQNWVLETVIRPAVALRLQPAAFDRMMRECEGYVRGAIWKVLATGKDLGILHQSCADLAEQNLWVWAMEHFDSLIEMGHPAKQSTRLYARARLEAQSIKTDAKRSRDWHDEVDLERIGRDDTGRIVIEPIPSDPDNPTPPAKRPARKKKPKKK